MSALIPPEGGVLGLLKPPGMTSHDAVYACRSLVGTRDVGHAGTLDPLAAGVLPLVFGPATRISEQLSWPAKAYRAEVVFGVKTDSGDLAGEIVADESASASAADPERVGAAVARLAGRRIQVPSPFSARKVEGRRLYELARRGNVSDHQLLQAAREIEVYSARMMWHGALGWGKYPSRPAALFEVTCSSGTYVRQLAEELGTLLGTVACLAFLVRTSCAGFDAGDCVTFDDLAIPASTPFGSRFARAWRRPAQALAFLPSLPADPDTAVRVGHGIAVSAGGLRQAGLSEASLDGGPGAAGAGGNHRRKAGFPLDASADGWVTVVDGEMRLIALARSDAPIDGGLPRIHPKKVFAPC